MRTFICIIYTKSNNRRSNTATLDTLFILANTDLQFVNACAVYITNMNMKGKRNLEIRNPITLIRERETRQAVVNAVNIVDLVRHNPTIPADTTKMYPAAIT